MRDVYIFLSVSDPTAIIALLQSIAVRLDEVAPHRARYRTSFSLETIALEIFSLIDNISDLVVLQHADCPCGIIIGRPGSGQANLGLGLLWVCSFEPLIDRPTEPATQRPIGGSPATC